MQVIIMSDHVAVGMAQPFHHHLLRHPAVRTDGTKVMPERMQPSIQKANLALRRGKLWAQWRQKLADQNVANGIGLELAAEGGHEK